MDYTLNAKDQRTKLTLPGGDSWAYAYDELGQVTGGVRKNADEQPQPAGLYKTL